MHFFFSNVSQGTGHRAHATAPTVEGTPHTLFIIIIYYFLPLHCSYAGEYRCIPVAHGSFFFLVLSTWLDTPNYVFFLSIFFFFCMTGSPVAEVRMTEEHEHLLGGAAAEDTGVCV